MAHIRVALIVAAGVLMGLPDTGEAAFPGQNGRIAFVSNRDGVATGNLDIYSMNPDGSDVVRLTTDPRPDDNPAWSSDGSRIAFDSQRSGPVGVVVMNADGSEQTVITPSGFFSPTGDPSWSPDGTKIVFQATTTSRIPELYVVNSDGTGGLTRLTDNTVFDGTPAWSPDGSKIAFTRSVPPCTTVVCNFEIFVINPDGTGEERLTFDADQDSDPNWSPDGSRIAWGNLTDDGADTAIYVMNADGSDQRGFAPPALGYEPAWSPRGDMIAWDESNEISVMNADGTGRRSVTNSPSFDVSPDWQPIPNEAPDCATVTPSRSVVKANHHRFVWIALAEATDPDGDPVTIEIDGVTQDEPVRGRRDRTAPDAVLKGDGVLRVRAERDQRGDGRVYRIAFTASDARGGSCAGQVTVSVPRKKRKPAVDSAPPSYDSLAVTP